MMSDLATNCIRLNEYLEPLLENDRNSEKKKWIVRCESTIDEPDMISFCTPAIRGQRLFVQCYEKISSNIDAIKKILEKNMAIESIAVRKFDINLLARAEMLPKTGEIFMRRCTSATMIKISVKFGTPLSKADEPLCTPLSKADEPPHTPPPKKMAGLSNRKAKKDSLAPLPRSYVF